MEKSFHPYLLESLKLSRHAGLDPACLPQASIQKLYHTENILDSCFRRNDGT